MGHKDKRDKWDRGNEHMSDPMGQGDVWMRGRSIHMFP